MRLDFKQEPIMEEPQSPESILEKALELTDSQERSLTGSDGEDRADGTVGVGVLVSPTDGWADMMVFVDKFEGFVIERNNVDQAEKCRLGSMIWRISIGSAEVKIQALTLLSLARRGILLGAAVSVALLGACKRDAVETGPLTQRGYLWQRGWNPQVLDGAREADRQLDGVVLLGGEMVWDGGKPSLIKVNIPWESLSSLRHPPAIALRIAPFPGPFVRDDEATRLMVATAKSLLDEARQHGIEPAEFQLDFDCAQKKLAGYGIWLRELRAAIQPVRFVITTLPVWLGEPEFPVLLKEVDGYVLQVHSVSTSGAGRDNRLCDPVLARRWVQAAAKLGRPFSVALPTYRCVAGFDPAGKLVGIAMDAGQPSWPADTRMLEFGADADEIADLVKEWRENRPAGLRELLWYRVPVSTDSRNWSWPTLAAVMQGRRPVRRYEVRLGGGNPVDLELENTGESDSPLDRAVRVTWSGPAPVASDALAGWLIDMAPGCVTFTPQPGARLRLAPGARRGIGWLRFSRTTELHCEIIESGKPSP